MKALVMSIFLAMTALSKALSEIISPAIKDPYLTWIWGAPAIALAVQTVVFWWKYRELDNDEFMTYEETTEGKRSEDGKAVGSEEDVVGKEKRDGTVL